MDNSGTAIADAIRSLEGLGGATIEQRLTTIEQALIALLQRELDADDRLQAYAPEPGQTNAPA